MAAEGKLRALLKKRVKAYGGEVRAMKWIGRSNAPDVLVLFPVGAGPQRHYMDDEDQDSFSCRYCKASVYHPGGHVFVETKGVEPDARKAQLREHARMLDAGCQVIVCRNKQELDEWLPPL
jgi:hypothetical protein